MGRFGKLTFPNALCGAYGKSNTNGGHSPEFRIAVFVPVELDPLEGAFLEVARGTRVAQSSIPIASMTAICRVCRLRVREKVLQLLLQCAVPYD